MTFELYKVITTKNEGAFKLVCSPPTVQTELGQDVVLSCAVEPPFDLTAQTVEWSRDADVIVHVYRSRADNQFLQNQKLRGRTILIHQNLKDGKVSLRLINITKEDEGNYSCCLPNHEVQSSVTLKVGERLINPSGWIQFNQTSSITLF
ncbi:Myelin-oligodendrocyte glycoprotein [Oryzias melastigma]|uniref:Myelin-oligodendrocyte glycoprotein n=1 Tax=Oryzias melastigma TaxID=30732 RepID=A0A834CAR8_ORYME|nr:Myelin-oligodendrocyte glycoprotein [Oryzias melastigma]